MQTSPNSKFANIKAIRRSQIEARERQNILVDSDNFASIAFTLSHITIEE
jgi:hypothetical protein